MPTAVAPNVLEIYGNVINGNTTFSIPFIVLRIMLTLIDFVLFIYYNDSPSFIANSTVTSEL